MDVVIVGGGFAGVQAARAVMKSLPGAAVTIVDRSGLSTMVPALPDAVSGRIRISALARPLSEAAGTGVSVRLAAASGVDTVESLVHTTAGPLHFDALILAPGSVSSPVPDALRGGQWHTLESLERALAFRDAVTRRVALGERPSVLIVGGGYTGLETAVALRGSTRTAPPPSVTVVEAAPDILGMVNERERDRLKTYLNRSGVDLRLSTTVESVSGESVLLSDGTEFRASVLCWAAGMRAAPIDLGEGVARTPDGRVEVNEFLQLPTAPSVFVAGDMASLCNGEKRVRRAVNFAYYSGRRAGKNVAAYLSGRELRPFVPIDLGWVIPLGGTSTGRVFGLFRVGGRIGLRMHYLMSGLRHFGGGYAGEFYRTAFNLRRRPAALDAPKTAEPV